MRGMRNGRGSNRRLDGDLGGDFDTRVHSDSAGILLRYFMDAHAVFLYRPGGGSPWTRSWLPDCHWLDSSRTLIHPTYDAEKNFLVRILDYVIVAEKFPSPDFLPIQKKLEI